MNLPAIIMVVLIILLIVTIYGYSAMQWSIYPLGGVGLLLLIVVVLVLLGKFPTGGA